MGTRKISSNKTYMLVKPFLAMVTLAERSLIEFPKAKIVTPIIVFGIRNSTPRKVKSSIRHSAMVSIHVAAIMKPKIDNGTEISKDKAPSVAGANRRKRRPRVKEMIKTIAM
jgi:hypothetical protein